MAYSLGWKDILRPIRDGYRHLFPSPDTGPTPEEREKQRQLDHLKGFTYFDAFAQLEQWTETDADPIQRANTPLLLRSTAASPQGEPKANVLLCHDFSGNYKDYEAATRIGVDSLSYHCQYLQYVESFVYFSHKLACVPPPSWTNTLHRNGVKAFGTLLFEPQTKDADGLLRTDTTTVADFGNVEFPVAKILARIAKHYGFDGWLVNIEKPFSADTWDPNLLDGFLRSLKEAMGDTGELIWYDALTADNRVAYQNSLTPKNLLFANACGAVLTNYCWTENDALSSRDLALKHGLPLQKIYFGIDVWAQNKTKLTQPRTTYPERGGGGTNTGVAVKKLSDMGFSAGIFAPAWSFEHFPGDGASDPGLGMDRVMWEGCALPDSVITCSCGDTRQRHPANRNYPIMAGALAFPASSDMFFYTDFSVPFARHGDNESQNLYNGMQLHSQLGAQSVFPDPSKKLPADGSEDNINFLTHDIQTENYRTYLRITFSPGDAYEPRGRTSPRTYEQSLLLFRLNMPADGTLQLFMSYMCPSHGTISRTTDIYLKFTGDIQKIRLEDCSDASKVQTIDQEINASEGSGKDGRLLELGVHVQSDTLYDEATHIMNIFEIRIVPKNLSEVSRYYSIHDIKIEKRGVGDAEHWRLGWGYIDNRHQDDGSVPMLPKIPYSDVTGPFSHFVIMIEGLNLGRAYAPEHVLPVHFIAGLAEKHVTVELIGFGFDGTEIARCEDGYVEVPP